MKAASFALLLGVLTSGMPGQAATSAKDIVDTAVAAGNFQKLTAALRAADLSETLRGEGPFTMFAPTDEAFRKLPEGTVEILLKPQNKQRLRSILLYHVVSGDVTAAQASKLGSVETFDKKALRLSSGGGGLTVNDAKVVKADVRASNGVIHVIDTVLIPQE